LKLVKPAHGVLPKNRVSSFFCFKIYRGAQEKKAGAVDVARPELGADWPSISASRTAGWPFLGARFRHLGTSGSGLEQECGRSMELQFLP